MALNNSLQGVEIAPDLITRTLMWLHNEKTKVETNAERMTLTFWGARRFTKFCMGVSFCLTL